MPNRDKTSGSGFGANSAPSGPTGTLIGSVTGTLTGSRKTYTTPVLQRFGQLNRVTQGSGGTKGDGSGTMTRGGGGMDMGVGDTRLMGMN